jgi:hypothetical protein
MIGSPGGVKVVVNRAKLAGTIGRIMRMKEAALDASQDSFRDILKSIKESSQLMVPRKTGALRDSAYFRVNRRSQSVEGEVGYDRNDRLGYAYVRHQVPAETYTTPGTTHQYLTLAFNQYEDVVADLVMKILRKRLIKLGFKRGTVGIF